MGALEFNPRKGYAMKKATIKKNTNKPSKKDTKKKRSYVSDMMRRDRESCIERDNELAKAGVKKTKKDIYKDDPCYGCKFAKENRDSNIGPFDRRFHCEGISRFTNQIGEAAGLIAEADAAKDERTRIKFLLQAQRAMLYAAMIVGERVENGRLECIQTSGKPSCFVGAELGEYLQASSKDVGRD